MNKYTGIILSGGQSRRMGTDKGLLRFNNKPLISYPIDVLSKYCTNIFISCNTNDYNVFELEIIKDVIPDIGPIGGIYTCLKLSKTELNIVLPCDMPFVDQSIIDLLISVKTDCPIIAPSINRRPIPVCAIYSRSIIPIIENQISNKNYKLQDLLTACNASTVEIDKPEMISSLSNLNTIEEFQKANSSMNTLNK